MKKFNADSYTIIRGFKTKEEFQEYLDSVKKLSKSRQDRTFQYINGRYVVQTDFDPEEPELKQIGDGKSDTENKVITPPKKVWAKKIEEDK